MTTHRVTAGRDAKRSHQVSGGDNSKMSDLGKSDSPLRKLNKIKELTP
jgi:hypothetical protein